MYKFTCKDIGLDCKFETTGESVEEVKQKALTHAATVHADMLKSMTENAKTQLTTAVVTSIKQK
jgi:predicted small metal-binding protein